ncbi:hypothetical protein [Actinomadura macrotermitis]|uniref:Uncharacterized protein n=1 Tax=Actinomadura macrotermitis TaxID=2585200 RepID=A0A7K0BQN1_9ACTN|nr:hypothetical protein [Actinomadura macrotermitis]MQY03437.1 hypothetical protein [Actinomadura macrotermitis]
MPEKRWDATAKFIVAAEDVADAADIGCQIMREMDVAARGEPRVAPADGDEHRWWVTVEVDLSPAGRFQPDDAVSRIRYLIRNLDQVTWTSDPEHDERRAVYEWRTPDSAHDEQEHLVHSAVRAATIQVMPAMA